MPPFSAGSTRSKTSRSPPTMTESLPSSRVTTLPETGASSMAAPRSATRPASSWLALGLAVLMSTYILPGPSPATTPSGPRVIASRAAVPVTMLKVTSAASATARGESAQAMPSAMSHSALARVRLWPITVWPAASSRLAIRPPMTPSPTKPISAMSALLCRAGGQATPRAAEGLVDVLLHLQQVGPHPLAGRLRPAGGDRVQDLAVVAEGPLRAAGDVGGGHSRPPQHVPV